MKTLSFAVFAVVAFSCGAPGPDDTKCVRGTLEADLVHAGPLTGPEVDATTGKLKPGAYVLSSTYLKLTTSTKGQAAFQASIKAITAVMDAQPGLAGYQLATSDECLTARTISVWKDEASMYRFVGVQAHADAVAQVSLTSRGGSVVTHWADSETGASFEAAASHVASAVGPFF